MLTAYLHSARAAQKIWGALSVRDRVALLKNFRRLVIQRTNELVLAIQKETFKPSAEAVGIEIGTVLLTLNHYNKVAGRLLKTQKVRPHWMFANKQVEVHRAPYGVVGLIGPSNLPFSLTLGDAIPALLAGNAVIIKPSEVTPSAAELGVELMARAGLPAGLVQVLRGGPEMGEALIVQVDFVFFTGSTKVGRKVGEQCGKLLKPCVLELGGKAPLIVLKDADLKRAARAAIWGRFANCGQHCIATERVFVAKEVAPAFKNLLVQEMTRLQGQDIGTPYVPGGLSRFEAQLNDALQGGAMILYDGRKEGVGPVIVSDVTPSMKVMQEETFGPLLPVAEFEKVEEAIAAANAIESGLSAVIFTRDKKQGICLAKKFESGNVSVNDVMTHFMVMGAPFAGWKSSGLGQRHGDQGLLQFTRPQTIFTHRFSLPFFKTRDPWWFPYQKIWEKILRLLLRFV